ncbi:type VI secretion protein [Erythrobacteraceae bacterium CFH 75059]|nr:TrbI/VirB10 family protein [Qipengyuania thermophila]TCD01935.1 type VI secretion protein [Erythrobacteraceae bacterium CFH 75059]
MATKLKSRGIALAPETEGDPRESESAEIIDFASRTAYAYPAVTQRRGRSDGLGMVAGIALVAGLGLVTLWSMSSARLEQPQGVGGQAPAGDPAQAVIAQPAAPADVTVVPPQPGTAGYAPAPVMADPAPAPVYASPPAPGAMPQANSLASPTMVFDGSAAPMSGEAGTAGLSPEAAATAPGNAAGDFASRVGGVGGGPARATPMTDPSTTITQGTLIPAVLETAIDTNVPGYVRAVVSQDVRSFDGSNVLVPRSSRLIGQYQSGLQNGQRRAYVIWTRLIRPDGASVNLASPAVGFDGSTGLRGEVRSNFFQRFGSAMLLSVVGGLSTIAGGGASVVMGGGQSAAAAAAQADGQIGPTVRVRQGEPIRIFTARDLNFTDVTRN